MSKLIWPLFLFTSFLLFGENGGDINLTQEEIKWIKVAKEKEVLIYLDTDLGILNYHTENGSNGIYPDIIKTLEEVTRLNFKVVKQEKKDFHEAVDSGIPHIVMGVEDYKRNRGKYYYLKDPINLSGVLITREDYPLTDYSTDLSGKTIVYVEGDQIVNEVIKRYGSRVILISKPSTQEAVESLLSGEADIYADDLQDGLKYMVENPDPEIKINYSSPSLKTRYYIGGLNYYKPLVDIIGRIVDTFDFNRRTVYEEVLEYTRDKLHISREIEDYLKKNSTLRVFIPQNIDVYPLFYKDILGKQEGFIVNYFYEIERILGVNIVFQEADSPEGLQINPSIMAINGEDINGEGFLTTDPYDEFQFLIFNREDEKYIPHLEDLRKYRIAVQKNSMADLFLNHMGFEENLIAFHSQKEVIKAVATGEADALIGGIQNTHYLLKRYNIKNIKLAGVINDKISMKFGVPREDETLYFVINSLSRDFSSGIEKRKKEFLERNIEITKDFKASIFITLVSALGFLGVFIHLKRFKRIYSKLTNITLGLVGTLESANSYNDEDTGDHVKRIGEYSHLIADELKLPREFVREVGLYASLHDIGKIGIPDSILKKPGKLTREEFTEMKKHTEIGFNLIKDLEVSPIAMNIIRHHHEKWDGSGYGMGLSGEDIPLEARIVALADVYDALCQKRIYKDPFSHE
ncbi:metal-dependent phosphohydrolase [Propionigenium maris DSM 9537]|uniref:Metal-dependent phosphohydrolase n=1 Tax=Propionigenium maris DSM 9537 TaxID=1123000 RepID=A0A9W6LLD7_9FUSO|nr:metal-dependent phosphohydrolase [Propionigenium maris DSM 9537]